MIWWWWWWWWIQYSCCCCCCHQTYGPYIGLHRKASRNDATCLCTKGYGGSGPSNKCQLPCPGNRNQICGGSNSVTYLHTFLGNPNFHLILTHIRPRVDTKPAVNLFAYAKVAWGSNSNFISASPLSPLNASFFRNIDRISEFFYWRIQQRVCDCDH